MASCPVTSRDSTSAAPSLDAHDEQVGRSLDRVRQFIEPRLEAAFRLPDDAPERLADAMRYATLAPGKRLRPALALWAAQACGRPETDATSLWTAAAPAAIAVEMIHAYSLVHDDLPAMDDDDLRRGRPTCHRAYDEATAILCGDALQALAFEVLAAGMPAAAAGRACLVLARAAGAEALVGGQVDDLAAERGWMSLRPTTADDQIAWMDRINRRKTGALFLAALELGGLAAAADTAQQAALASFGRAFGIAFQIADDVLDAEGTEAAMGKRVGKDADRGKITYPTVAGIAAARERARDLAAQAVAAVEPLGKPAAELAALARWIVARDH
ncbi:MAG: polyprenyl synthetase family protein [Planctomycetia bacterium]|nr:polyprenyl synthetase family protein [Planctomycetia bacterium]